MMEGEIVEEKKEKRDVGILTEKEVAKIVE